MRPRAKNSGFVLLMVLLVLVISGTILSSAARRCGQSTVQAGNAQRELQLRWGALSCRTSALPLAERMLQERQQLQREQTPNGPIPIEAYCSMTLGSIEFHLIVADEQAKANANLLAELYGDAGLADSLRHFQANDRRMLPVRLRPIEDAPDGELLVLYASFDQLFRIHHPSELVGSLGEAGPLLRRRLTCWGNGRINLRRADVMVLREVLAEFLTDSQVVSLDEFRRAEPDLTVGEALRHLQLSKRRNDQLKLFVTDRSECHSLWLVAKEKTRFWYRLYLRQAGRNGKDWQELSFCW